jgi:hypothetical protein
VRKLSGWEPTCEHSIYTGKFRGCASGEEVGWLLSPKSCASSSAPSFDLLAVYEMIYTTISPKWVVGNEQPGARLQVWVFKIGYVT